MVLLWSARLYLYPNRILLHKIIFSLGYLRASCFIFIVPDCAIHMEQYINSIENVSILKMRRDYYLLNPFVNLLKRIENSIQELLWCFELPFSAIHRGNNILMTHR